MFSEGGYGDELFAVQVIQQAPTLILQLNLHEFIILFIFTHVWLLSTARIPSGQRGLRASHAFPAPQARGDFLRECRFRGAVPDARA